MEEKMGNIYCITNTLNSKKKCSVLYNIPWKKNMKWQKNGTKTNYIEKTNLNRCQQQATATRQ